MDWIPNAVLSFACILAGWALAEIANRRNSSALLGLGAVVAIIPVGLVW